jgi:hypothetical protein
VTPRKNASQNVTLRSLKIMHGGGKNVLLKLCIALYGKSHDNAGGKKK